MLVKKQLLEEGSTHPPNQETKHSLSKMKRVKFSPFQFQDRSTFLRENMPWRRENSKLLEKHTMLREPKIKLTNLQQILNEVWYFMFDLFDIIMLDILYINLNLLLNTFNTNPLFTFHAKAKLQGLGGGKQVCGSCT